MVISSLIRQNKQSQRKFVHKINPCSKNNPVRRSSRSKRSKFEKCWKLSETYAKQKFSVKANCNSSFSYVLYLDSYSAAARWDLDKLQ